MTRHKKPAQSPETGLGATNDAVEGPDSTKRTGLRGSIHAPPTNAFPPGVSGNPGGRRRMSDSMREAKEAKADAQPAAVAYLLSVVEDRLAEPRDRITAAKALVDDLKLEALKVDVDVTADVKHDVKAEVIQSFDRMRTIAAVLLKSGVLELTETAGPVEIEEKS